MVSVTGMSTEDEKIKITISYEDEEGKVSTMEKDMDLTVEEATEDMERMAGVLDDSDIDYLDMSVWRHVKNRFPWLFFLMLSYVLTGKILSASENTLAQIPALVVYMPRLM